MQYIRSVYNEKVIQQIKARKKKAAQEKETPFQNWGPGTILEHAHINRTCVPPLGIWAQTSKVKQNIHKTSCTDNQHAQTLYYSHTKKNICANENVYTIQRFTDTYRQKNTGHQQNIQDPPIAETNQRDELHGQGGGQNSLTLGSSIEVLRAR